MRFPEVLAFVRASLSEPPARVLEVGAGDGELAAALRDAGYDVLAIDPAATTPGVKPIPLAELDEPDDSFDAAVAVVSLHHVDPLPEACARLAGLVRTGGTLIVDEFDTGALDERAVSWWCHQRAAAGRDHPEDPAAVLGELRSHLHSLSTIHAELGRHFAVGQPIRGPYLYRWNLPPGLREPEELLIGAGALPATGARLVCGVKPDPVPELRAKVAPRRPEP
jgi:SAM-dependent methyltransferase